MSKIHIVQRIIVYAAIVILGVVLGANVYNSIVDAPNWGSAIPESLEATKSYFAHANPGTFYRKASPAAQVAALLVLIATWPAGKRVRILAAVALVTGILGDVLTFAYFYPRNALMFGPGQRSIEILREAWSQWSSMNWVRSGCCLIAMLFELALLSALERYHAKRAQS